MTNRSSSIYYELHGSAGSDAAKWSRRLFFGRIGSELHVYTASKVLPQMYMYGAGSPFEPDPVPSHLITARGPGQGVVVWGLR